MTQLQPPPASPSPAWRRILWPGIATVIALGILLTLGTWQMNRKLQKEALLHGLNTALTASPLSLETVPLLGISVHDAGYPSIGYSEFAELKRVELSGVFMPSRSVPVRATLPATKGGLTSGIGFFWMTPLETSNGDIVFINRGFVNSGGDWKAPAIPTPEGRQVIIGLVRKPEARQTFTPHDTPAKGEYFIRDPDTMARAVGIEPTKVARFFVDAERTPGNLTPPVGVDPREMIARIPNNHLQYAVTWFAFALTLLGVFAVFARARLKETQP